MSPYQKLVDALNELADETGVEAISITFNQSDVPVDWDWAASRWHVEEGK